MFSARIPKPRREVTKESSPPSQRWRFQLNMRMELVVIETGELKSPKTKELIKKIDQHGWVDALIIDGSGSMQT